MQTQFYERQWVWGMLVFVFLALVGCSAIGTPSAPAVLTGKVSVGPLEPVERAPEPGQTPTPIPEQVFTSRSVNIYREDGKTLVQSVPFNGDGTYRVELRPGTYVVAMPPEKIEFARDLPKTVTLISGETVQLDIDIDTGIR
ncbi:MAG: hypothetical protein EHM21_19170 [Chloroflexi bacterium]|nr:MAG: hypothetical protein EHM21_19170 [Chloroflexota bacterium]